MQIIFLWYVYNDHMIIMRSAAKQLNYRLLLIYFITFGFHLPLHIYIGDLQWYKVYEYVNWPINMDDFCSVLYMDYLYSFKNYRIILSGTRSSKWQCVTKQLVYYTRKWAYAYGYAIWKIIQVHKTTRNGI